jgi:hypothetical protein
LGSWGVGELGSWGRLDNWAFKDNYLSQGNSDEDIVITQYQNYMVPALELFLIQKLRPPINSNGKHI